LPDVVTNYLDGDALANALVSGIHRVIDEQDYLNRINVFPVADGDTGTNLSLSLGAALAVLTRPGEKHLGTLLAAIADALLDGARGNSGAIVAQFFQGVSDSAGELTRFTTYTFSKAISQGNEYAHDALSKPREGTILSVIAAFAQTIAIQVGDARDSPGNSEFPALMTAALRRASDALAATTEQLDVLRKAGVVDAGARGFVALIEGMHEYILHGRIAAEPDLSVLRGDESPVLTVGSADDSEYRYCTECIVTGTDIDRRKLREALSELGDSLVLAGTKRKARIHVHVNDPEDVFDTGRLYGDVSSEKADDMHRQTHSSHDATKKFAVITDSAADIADEDMERLDIHMVPCRIQFGDRGYLDKVSITAEEFFSELATNPSHPTTSQPAPGDFRRQFQFLASHFADVISINLTATASGTYEAARSAAARTNAPGRIHVINSFNASLGQGQLVVFAAECASAGLSAEETIAAVEALVPKTHTFALLNDLHYAVRGGRLPRWVKTVAELLRLTPIVRTTTDGRIAAGSFFLGKQNRIARFARHVARRISKYPALNIAIAHAVCPDDAAEFERSLRELLPQIEHLSTTSLGAGLGVHGGPGTLLVAAQPYAAPAAG
jgi:DegV family protein with EDD domain